MDINDDDLLVSLIHLADALAHMPDVPDEKTGYDFYTPLKRAAYEILVHVEPEHLRAATSYMPDEWRYDYHA